MALLSHKYERHGLCATAKDRIPAADGLSKVLPIHVSRYYLWGSSDISYKISGLSYVTMSLIIFSNSEIIC